jgi:abnormal spindle-like microcephaly-associated protein
MHSWRRSYAVATAVCQRATKRRVLVQLALARRAGLQRRAAQVAFMERKRRDRMVASAITLQRGIRAWRQRRAEARRVAAAQVIQAAARRYLSVRDAVRRERAALVLQSWARGHAARRRAAPAIATVRRRLLAASEAARKNPKLRIGYRLATALEALLTSRQLSVVTQALRSLDQVTRVLPICCEEVVKLGAIQVMLALMQSCNRSLPHQELVSVALSVLRNIAAYASTARTVFEPHNLVDVLTELMQIYRDKEDLFAKATALLLAGTRVRGFALYVRGLPDIPRRLRGLAAVLENKLKMAERLSRPTPEAQQRFVAQKANLAQLQQLLAALDAP